MKRMRTAAMSLVLAAACSFAQDAQNEQKKEQEKEEAAPRAKQISFTLGYYDWGLKGNAHKLRQYATPTSRLAITSIDWHPKFLDGGAFLHVATPGESDYALDGKVTFLNGKLTVEGAAQRNMFYDKTPTILPESQRRTEGLAVRYNFQHDLSLSANITKEKRDQNFLASDPRHDLNYFWNGMLEGNMSGSFVSAGYSERRYFDRMDIRPDTKVRQWSGSIFRSFGPSVDAEASYSRSTILQQGQFDATIESLALGGSWMVGPNTELGFKFRDDKIDLPQVQSAWDRERINASATLFHNIGNWRLQAGYTHKEHERVRADQSFADVPRWDIYEGRVYGRLSDKIRLSARARQESLRKGGLLFTDDPRALYFDNRFNSQIKLDGGNEKMAAYLVYDYGFLGNKKRDVSIKTGTITGGTTYQVNDMLEAFGELSYESSTARSEPLDIFTLGNYFPKGKSLVLGLNWNAREDTFVSASFNEFVTDNDNPLNLPDGNVHGRAFTASVRHRAKDGNEYSITVSPWRYDDKMLFQMGYRATLLQVTARFRY